MATSLKLDESTKQRLRHAANLRDRSPHWLMKKAVEEFLDREEKRESFRSEALDSMREYQNTGHHLSLNETLDWMGRWGTDEETKAPECHQ